MPAFLFIVSAPRSGSTLLVAALARHPRIGMTNEAGWIAFLRKAQLLAHTPALQRIDDGEGFTTQGILPHKYLADFAAAFDGLVGAFVSDFYVRVCGERAWYGDKILSHNDLAFAVEHFPGAKYVELVRDPRDVLVSTFAFQHKQPTPWEHASFEERCRHLDRFHAATASLLQGRDRLLVRYEDLVRDPCAVLTRVLAFAEPGLELDAAVRAYLAGPAADLFGAHGTSTSPAESIGRWRDQLSRTEQELAQALLGEHLRRFAD